MDWVGGKGGLEGGCVCLDSVCNDFFYYLFYFSNCSLWTIPCNLVLAGLVRARDSSPVGRGLFVVRIKIKMHLSRDVFHSACLTGLCWLDSCQSEWLDVPISQAHQRL